MVYEVLVESGFVARHAVRLPNGTVECVHEHDWRVTVRFVDAELDECGLLIDFGVAKSDLDHVLAQFDQTDLNRNPTVRGLNPTAEHVAKLVFEGLLEHCGDPDRLQSVRVSEAPGCAAVYGRGERG